MQMNEVKTYPFAGGMTARPTMGCGPLLAGCAGHVIWGFSVLFSRVALYTASPEVLLSVRLILASLLMTLPVLTGKVRVSLRGKNLRPLLLLVAAEVLYFYFESYAILYTGATFAGAVLALTPIAAMLLSAVFLKERPSRWQGICCLLPIAGVTMMTASGSSLGTLHAVGVVFAVCTCFASAGYKTANRKAAEEFTPFERAYFVLLSCAAVFTVSALCTLRGDLRMYVMPLKEPTFLVSVLMLSGFCSIGANILVNHAAGHMPVTKLAALEPLTTLCAMASGVVFLQEPMTKGLLLGGVLILMGIYYMAQPRPFSQRDIPEKRQLIC